MNASEGFDASTFTRVSAGIYTIELTEKVDESHILTSIQALSSTGACLICGAQIEPDHKTLAIHVQDAAGADHDGELIQIGVFLFKSA